MNYLKVYCKLIRNAESRNWKRKYIQFYIEEHHIFPVSIYGKNDRIVGLTPREQFLVHWLLYKICLKSTINPTSLEILRCRPKKLIY